MLNKKRIGLILAIIAIILGIIFIKLIKENMHYSLELAPNQKLIDYGRNQQWLFAIIEEKKGIDVERKIYVYSSGDPGKAVNSDKKVNWRKVREYDFTLVLPWKIELGDLDYTDGPQVVMGVNKSTHFDREANDRLFVYNWDGEKLYKKWTGTRLGYYLKDFYIMDFLDMIGEELIVVDKDQEGKDRLLVYYWLDFGFQLLAESKFYDRIDKVKYIDNNLLGLVYIDNGNEITTKVMVEEGWVVEVD
ncbi:MAG: hypothetical protein WDA24_01930 [Tissierellales bacterium]